MMTSKEFLPPHAAAESREFEVKNGEKSRSPLVRLGLIWPTPEDSLNASPIPLYRSPSRSKFTALWVVC